MGTDDDGDVAMDVDKTDADTAEADKAPAEPEKSADDRVIEAEGKKGEGNDLLKLGKLADAIAKYAEGIELTEALLEKTPEEVGVELQQRCTLVYTALRLNSAQVCLKSGENSLAADHASKVLLIDKSNPKALYRRAMACMHFDSEGRLEQARSDLQALVQIETGNRDAREQLAKAKERLKGIKQLEKERYAKMSGGGLYKEQHDKSARERTLYDEEVARKKEAGEEGAEQTFEDWQKKKKEAADDAKKKEKEAKETREKEARATEELRLLDEINEKRKADGLEALSLEAWREEKRNAKTMTEDVVNLDSGDLDEEEKKLLEESKKKGYYHGRLGTVLSSEAPAPQQVDAASTAADGSPDKKLGQGAAWNTMGLWEDKDQTTWAKEEMKKWLGKASVSSGSVVSSAGARYSVAVRAGTVKSLEGDAQIVVVRGRPRFGYTFVAEVSVHFSFTSLDAPPAPPAVAQGAEGVEPAAPGPASPPAPAKFRATVKLPELSDEVDPSDLNIVFGWKGDSPPANLQSLTTEYFEKFKENIRLQVANFVQEYQKR